MTTGIVKFYDLDRGFGFIATDNDARDVYVHASAIEQARLGQIAEGQTLSFDIETATSGPRAVNLHAAFSGR